jgi:hypothetical protein
MSDDDWQVASFILGVATIAVFVVLGAVLVSTIELPLTSYVP